MKDRERVLGAAFNLDHRDWDLDLTVCHGSGVDRVKLHVAVRVVMPDHGGVKNTRLQINNFVERSACIDAGKLAPGRQHTLQRQISLNHVAGGCLAVVLVVGHHRWDVVDGEGRLPLLGPVEPKQGHSLSPSQSDEVGRHYVRVGVDSVTNGTVEHGEFLKNVDRCGVENLKLT